jgi:signal transduction histidine kinase
MRERATCIRGELTVQAEPSRGTKLHLSVPIRGTGPRGHYLNG